MTPTPDRRLGSTLQCRSYLGCERARSLCADRRGNWLNRKIVGDAILVNIRRRFTLLTLTLNFAWP
jgi:hypothetical protein